MNFSIKNVEEYSLFLNKFWNILRFTWMNVGDITESRAELREKINSEHEKLLPYERWILSRLALIVEKTTASMEDYSFGATGTELIAFIRDEFADFAIESYKIEKDRSELGKTVLSLIALEILALMHPYIPHITESLYGHITGGKMLATDHWPKNSQSRDEASEKKIETIFKIVRTVRNIRAEKNIKPGECKDVWIVGTPEHEENIRENTNLLSGLAKIGTLTVGQKPEDTEQTAYGILEGIEIYVDAAIDRDEIQAELDRIKEQIEDKKHYLRGIAGKLANPSFAKNAPEPIVRAEMEKKHQAEIQIAKLEEKYGTLNARL